MHRLPAITTSLPSSMLRRTTTHHFQNFNIPSLISRGALARFHLSHTTSAKRNPTLEKINNILGEEERQILAQKMGGAWGQSSGSAAAPKASSSSKQGATSTASDKSSEEKEEAKRLENIVEAALSKEPRGDGMSFSVITALLFLMVITVGLSQQRDCMEAEMCKEVLGQTQEELVNEIQRLRSQKERTEKHLKELIATQHDTLASAKSTEQKSQAIDAMVQSLGEWFERVRSEDEIIVQREYDHDSARYVNRVAGMGSDKSAWTYDLMRILDYNVEQSA